jgi:hypothetical protein
MNPGTEVGGKAARKSLEYARGVTGIEAALAPCLTTFQNHILAFTGVIDATLDQPHEATDLPPSQK